jgi:hypothetical protein
MSFYNLDELISSLGYYRKYLADKLCVPNYMVSKAIHQPERYGKHVGRLKQLLVERLNAVNEHDFDVTLENTIMLNKKRHEAAKRDWE